MVAKTGKDYVKIARSDMAEKDGILHIIDHIPVEIKLPNEYQSQEIVDVI